MSDYLSRAHRTHRSFAFFLALPVFTVSVLACMKLSDSTVVTSSQAHRVDGSVIYGLDNRREFYEETNPALRRAAESTLALIKTTELKNNGDGSVSIRGENFGQKNFLCETERFREQDTAAFCTGFLVAPDIIMTAGHCITSLLSCQETSFVFGFAYSMPHVAPFRVPETSVYSCQQLVRSHVESDGVDFALIRLDRPVQGRLPLTLRRSGTVNPGDDLSVLGHPAGLPLKIADGAKVRRLEADKGYFVANLDTYGGNSGSPVLNMSTYEVEGILVRGERDYVLNEEGDQLCYMSNVCPDDQCRGEDVTIISETLKHF